MVSLFMVRNKFSKQERLCSLTAIGELFSKGNSFFVFPLKVVFLIDDDSGPIGLADEESTIKQDSFQHKESSPKEGIVCKVLFSVPKKQFRHAVDRNRIKRQLREAFRLQKHEMIEHFKADKKQISLAFVYTSKGKVPFSTLSDALNNSLRKIQSISKDMNERAREKKELESDAGL